MTTTAVRLVSSAPEREAEALFAHMEAAFEDDGYALACVEVVTDSGIREIAVYLPDDDADRIAETQSRLADCLKAAGLHLDFAVEVLPDVDWVALSLEGLKPVRAGRFVVHGAHDRSAVGASDIGIEIEAGQAFGTGHHGTTWGCLSLIGDVLKRRIPAVTLDLGTGSAVLAIAIAKAARVPVLATDIDPVATKVATGNVRLNQVQDFVECATATGFAHEAFRRAAPFDLIVANILARPLMKLAPQIAIHAAPGADIVLSGILTHQRWPVIAAMNGAGLTHVRTISCDGWVAIHLQR